MLDLLNEGINFFKTSREHPLLPIIMETQDPTSFIINGNDRESQYHGGSKGEQQRNKENPGIRKSSKIKVILLGRHISQIFEDLNSELLIVLFPLEFNKFDL